MSKTKNIISLACIILILTLGISYLVHNFFLNPCRQPITYSIGEIDPRFNLTRSDVIKALNQAEAIWEKPTGKNLFAYDEAGKLKVSFVYDSRQESTVTLQRLGMSINEDEKTYDSLKIQYNASLSGYNTQKQTLTDLIDRYNSAKAEYDSEVTTWNKKGGAPKQEYDRLNEEKNSLMALASQIQSLQGELNKMVDTINAMANVLNRLAAALNLNVNKYNTIGLGQETEFQEGVYKKDLTGAQIIVYQFDSYTKLVRVLAHEFGHALGLSHFNNPEAIMYSVNQSDNLNLSAPEISAVKAMCRIP